MKNEQNPLHKPQVAAEITPQIEDTARTYDSLTRIPRFTKDIAKKGSIAVLGAGMAVGLLSSGEGPAEPIDFDNVANHLNEDGVNVIEAPDGTQYEGVWLDGDTGNSWADLGLTNEERQQVLSQNGLDAIPNQPTTIFVETSLLDKSE